MCYREQYVLLHNLCLSSNCVHTIDTSVSFIYQYEAQVSLASDINEGSDFLPWKRDRAPELSL